ncbi:ShlB/FhaC/HecB family hemolysin secretion/activation protein [Sphingomonas glacialis]|uniref:ShlB/FhaC/HecB family hemolysin secretion/activation protein n=1 Tax=Sphingomonas glacialis TaxID=658225 RepID=A0A502FZK2_9SPHN|nr:ShlB/FhaC/HecB family hemolysin secretion/activation protein [Sphingomonas glacialis]TPG54899.1 ShlB/FhaC/HecB family hemolysin secretion/activation protein [Sphingomonas glacialis]
MDAHLRILFFVSAVAGSFGGNGAAAQTSGPVPAQLSQLPSAPVPPASVPDLRITTPDVAAEQGPTGIPFSLHALHVSGQTRFTEGELVAATGFVPDRMLTLPDLRNMALRITRFYNAHGYIVAQAYVHAQKILDGAVTIAVIEGHYGAITLQNGSHLRDGTAKAVLRGLDHGDLVAAAPLERRLLLLSDLPGVRVRSTLSPGADVGTSDLLVDVTPGHRITGDVEVSNAGNPYTGLYQGGGTINLNEPLGIGDVLSLRVLTSGGGLQYGRVSYQAQAGNLTLGAAYAYFHYRLGEQFDVLDATGSQQIGSLYAAYPLVRSYDNNLQLRGQFDYRAMRDNIDAFASVSRRRAEVLSIGLTGDHHDRFGGGGWDSYSLYLSGGNLDIRTPLIRVNDAATARTNGHFGKLRFSADRLRTVTGPLSLYAGVRGQIAFNNLDVTEKMELGGANGVRAYPEGEVYGDEGYIATAEARVMLDPIKGLPGRLQVAGFYDYGQIWLNHTPWLGGDNRFTRHGVGASLTWLRNDSFLARASYAFQLGAQATSYRPNSTGQFRFEVIKFFG